MKLRTWRTSEAYGAAIWCAPCGRAHSVPLAGPNAWTWNGDRAYPTLTPSLLVTQPNNTAYRCHSIVTGGNIHYCNDSLHALAGKTVPLETFPTGYGGSWDDEQGEPMRFEITDSLIVYHDEQPGNHAVLFQNGARVPFNSDASSFNDGARRYAWAFYRPATIAPGDIFAFATADREVFGVVADDGVSVSVLLDPRLRVIRLGDKPFAVEATK